MPSPSRDHDLPGLMPALFDAQGSSFVEMLRRTVPDALPGGADGDLRRLVEQVPEGTTVLAVTYADGVIIAGDRRATAGNFISRQDMRKVFPADEYSAIAISGVAGPAMELAKIFATELEHYEKVEGEHLSLEGKSNRLAHMIRGNLPLAMQGMIVVPLFAGYDLASSDGRIFEYDPVGGRYRSTDFAATGSGSMAARGALKHLYDRGADRSGAIRTSVTALFEAAEQDSATGGPDLIRRIYPIVAVINADGYAELDDDEVAGHVQAIVEQRQEREERQGRRGED